MSRMSNVFAVPALVLFVLAAPGAALATTYGNPAPQFNKGDLGPGISLSDDRETLFLDWGVSDPGTLRFLLGVVDLGGDDGTEFGIGYRHKFSENVDVGDASLQLGALGMFRMGEADNNSDVEFNQLDLGFGGAFSPVENVNAYGIAIYRRTEVENRNNSVSDTDVGVVLGAELWISDGLVVGGELHLAIDDDDFGFFAQFKF